MGFDLMMMLCPPGVYRAQDDTAMLTEVMHRGGYAVGRHVLDVGTGSGALALAASRGGAASVTAVDLSWRSVLATWSNCRVRNAAVTVRRGDLFAPVAPRRFDLIVANPPYVPAPTSRLPRFRRARCWDAGLDGRAVLDRLCAGAATMLAPTGTVLLVHSAVCGAQRTLDRLRDGGLVGEVVERARVPFGPVMHARARMLEERGLIGDGDRVEELVVIEARHAG
ncbi:HemK2/MTQ2 family protein methyltransferase [Pseudonocardia spinosispora]|uniref:HemK2/MTQ2 family protein methyltransferase n=1 Tax=Pseudonocardia spinosispora TaxID=103441 RepID=UPI00040C6ECA|nr:HemK2/MTQ2 family protein methyltransferase [Pseudonocardia spinosispora]